MKILDGGEHICLFCGKEKEKEWDEYDYYYECYCDDAKKYKSIKEEIDKLELSLPKPKFIITSKLVMYKENESSGWIHEK